MLCIVQVAIKNVIRCIIDTAGEKGIPSAGATGVGTGAPESNDVSVSIL